ncbi:MAG: PQQ-dependent sugar dehydrogenase [Chloroherpetonaceae bacterium]|nr:PQQ-dependent sugar dehydrogenase [Chloroherpetonaceae bacterium]
MTQQQNVFSLTHLTLICCLLFSASFVLAQPSGVRLTPIKDLKLRSVALEIPEQYKGLIEPKIVNLPQGWRAKVFYIGGNGRPKLDKPRFMAWSPDSTIYVANKNSGEIIALPDRNRDGVADEAFIAAEGFDSPHDVAFYQDALYVTEERRVWKLNDDDRDGRFETRSVFINNIASGATQPGGGHDTRTLAFDEKNGKVYLSIGSLCNVCREDYRAIIEEYSIEGKNRRIYASGIRNAVGLTVHPRTNALWATNNGSDNQGNDIPPEWIDIIRDGGFYGYPIAYAHGVYFDFYKGSRDYERLLPITKEDSARVRSMKQPAALVQAHSALMAIEFANETFPKEFKRGAFVAYRGSWNRNPATGYKVVYLDFDNDFDLEANSVSDFLTGFVPKYDGSRPERWGRPVGLLTDRRGRLFIGSDDTTHLIICVYPSQ